MYSSVESGSLDNHWNHHLDFLGRMSNVNENSVSCETFELVYEVRVSCIIFIGMKMIEA